MCLVCSISGVKLSFCSLFTVFCLRHGFCLRYGQRVLGADVRCNGDDTSVKGRRCSTWCSARCSARCSTRIDKSTRSSIKPKRSPRLCAIPFSHPYRTEHAASRPYPLRIRPICCVYPGCRVHIDVTRDRHGRVGSVGSSCLAEICSDGRRRTAVVATITTTRSGGDDRVW